MEKKVKECTSELDKATDTLINIMARVSEMRDNDTGKHVIRVGKYARILSSIGSARAYLLLDRKSGAFT